MHHAADEKFRLVPIAPYVVFLCAVGVSIWLFGAQLLFRLVALPPLQKSHASYLVLAEAMLRPQLADGDRDTLRENCRVIARSISLPVTVLDETGRIVAQSSDTSGTDASSTGRTLPPEAVLARALPVAHDLRQDSGGRQILFTAGMVVPESGPSGEKTRFFIQLQQPIGSVFNSMAQLAGNLALGWLVLSGLLLFFVFRTLQQRVVRPLSDLGRVLPAAIRQRSPEMVRVFSPTHIAPGVLDFSRILYRTFGQLLTDLQRAEILRRGLETVLACMEEPLLVVDEKKVVTKINRAACRVFQVSESEALGRPLLHATRNLELQEIVSRMVEGAESVEHEVRLTDAAGSVAFLQAHAVRIGPAGEKESGILVVMADITRIRHMENIRRDFVANVSHELLTPITAIKGFVETMLDETEEDDCSSPTGSAHRKFLTIISGQANRLEAIISDLLALSRLEAGEATIEKEPVSVARVIEGVFETCSVKAEEKSIAFTAMGADDYLMQANPRLLEQAVTNLVTNAVKYSYEKGRVEVEWGTEGNMAVIRVRDFGVGIEAKHHARLFERFYRSDAARSRKLGGTGLGLAIVKHIIQAHGGTVAMESTPGKGSVFSICLPLQA